MADSERGITEREQVIYFPSRPRHDLGARFQWSLVLLTATPTETLPPIDGPSNRSIHWLVTRLRSSRSPLCSGHSSSDGEIHFFLVTFLVLWPELGIALEAYGFCRRRRRFGHRYMATSVSREC